MKRHLMLTGKGTLMHKWRIGPVDLGLAKTDHFDLDVDAVVGTAGPKHRLPRLQRGKAWWEADTRVI
jgi:hypothetical protein